MPPWNIKYSTYTQKYCGVTTAFLQLFLAVLDYLVYKSGHTTGLFGQITGQIRCVIATFEVVKPFWKDIFVLINLKILPPGYKQKEEMFHLWSCDFYGCTDCGWRDFLPAAFQLWRLWNPLSYPYYWWTPLFLKHAKMSATSLERLTFLDSSLQTVIDMFYC